MMFRIFHIALFVSALVVVAASMAVGKPVHTYGTMEYQERADRCPTPVIVASGTVDGVPYLPGSPDHGGASNIYITTADAVPHAPVPGIATCTLAIVIALIHSDDDRPLPSREPSTQTVLHKVLFRSIISPNAP